MVHQKSTETLRETRPRNHLTFYLMSFLMQKATEFGQKCLLMLTSVNYVALKLSPKTNTEKNRTTCPNGIILKDWRQLYLKTQRNLSCVQIAITLAKTGMNEHIISQPKWEHHFTNHRSVKWLCAHLSARQCVLRHYTGKHNVLDIWTNEFLHAINNKALTPNMMYMVENVNFNAQKGKGEKFDVSQLSKLQSIKPETSSFKCILCKDEQNFTSR